jgi:hypothetical protein
MSPEVQVVNQINTINNTITSIKKKNKNKIIEVNYSDLCDNPEYIVSNILKFLGEHEIHLNFQGSVRKEKEGHRNDHDILNALLSLS